MRISAWFVLAAVVVLAGAAVGASYVSYIFVRDRAAELDRVLELPDLPQVGHAAANPTPTPQPPAVTVLLAPDATTGPGVPAATVEGQASANGSPRPWDDPRRVTVLLLGIDQRAGEQGTFPTDTMILLSIDPAGKTAAILSIPRDLWVDYPAGTRQAAGRINSANIIGDEISYPGGGPAFAAKTVEKHLYVQIDYYVLINFAVFTTLVDAIGPIEVCPPEPIDDDRYPDGSYGYITIHFDAGCQELDSERLLQYARTRHGDSDIARSGRQQEVILAVRDKILSTGGVMALLPQAPALWEAVQDNIRTNLSFEQIVSLGLKAEEIDPENIRRGQITFQEVYSSTTPEGDAVLIPIATDIRLLVEDLFRPAGAPSAREQK